MESKILPLVVGFLVNASQEDRLFALLLAEGEKEIKIMVLRNKYVSRYGDFLKGETYIIPKEGEFSKYVHITEELYESLRTHSLTDLPELDSAKVIFGPNLNSYIK